VGGGGIYNLYSKAAEGIMFTRTPDHYCPVCASAVHRVIDLHLGR